MSDSHITCQVHPNINRQANTFLSMSAECTHYMQLNLGRLNVGDLDGMSDQYALPNLFTTRYMQSLTLYGSWMTVLSTNFKEILEY